MGNLSKTLWLTLMAFAPSAEACRDIVPDQAEIPPHESVFEGRVSGIRLDTYDRTGRDLDCEGEQEDGGPECISHIAGSPPVIISAVPLEVFRGNISGVQEVQQAGCARADIQLGETAIFFVKQGAGTAVIVWRSQNGDYESWLKWFGRDIGR
ncbi:MAG: hypothetical protein J0H15_08575 [Xanthomonadales bacterium]|nr:hypothetical protein [Xanthomonadales bacterium]